MIWPYAQYRSESKTVQQAGVPSIAVIDDCREGIRNMSNPLSEKPKGMKATRA
jgi:hypothetical protein